MVPLNLLAHARSVVPPQQDTWSCGINSAARFAAMIRQTLVSYNVFHGKAPSYGGTLFIPRIGLIQTA